MKNIKDLKELKQLSLDLVSQFVVPQVVLLKGDLAVGKTQMVKYMAEALGASLDAVQSPTFSLINAYGLKTGEEIQHVDLYRVQSDKELNSIGFWDLFSNKKGLIFIEWPERVIKELPSFWNKILIEIKFAESSTQRKLEWKKLS